MTGKITTSSKNKSFKVKKSLQRGKANIRAMLIRLLRSLKPKKKSDEILAEDLENRLNQMLSVSTNDLLNLDSTLA